MIKGLFDGMSVQKIVISCFFAGLSMAAIPEATAHDNDGAERHSVSYKLPNVPGKTITAIVVSYPPGGKSPAHRHAGSVMAYVLSGAIRSENSATGAVRVYRTGETFFEPPGSVHLISENASDAEPASLLAVFVAETDAVLTQPAQ